MRSPRVQETAIWRSPRDAWRAGPSRWRIHRNRNRPAPGPRRGPWSEGRVGPRHAVCHSRVAPAHSRHFAAPTHSVCGSSMAVLYPSSALLGRTSASNVWVGRRIRLAFPLPISFLLVPHGVQRPVPLARRLGRQTGFKQPFRHCGADVGCRSLGSAQGFFSCGDNGVQPGCGG